MPKIFLRYFVFLWSVFLLSIPAHAADNFAPQPIAKDERCPVCGMYPANYPKWHSQIVFKDGGHASFDSATDMLSYLKAMAKYDKRHAAADIAKIYVPDHAKGGWLDARQSFFVKGSIEKGPMMDEALPAFDTKEKAEAFARKAGGKVLRLEAITTFKFNLPSDNATGQNMGHAAKTH